VRGSSRIPETAARPQEFDALRQEFNRFRDRVTAQFAGIRLALQHLTARVDRLDDRRNNPVG
jgi:hypothetical protein